MTAGPDNVGQLVDQIDMALRSQGAPGRAEHEPWLLPRAALASAVTLREAIKPLSEPQRAAVLAAR